MGKELEEARADAFALVEHFEGSNVPGGDRAERRRLGSSLRMLLQRLFSAETSLTNAELASATQRVLTDQAEKQARALSALVEDLEAKLAKSEAVRESLAKNATTLDEERSREARAAIREQGRAEAAEREATRRVEETAKAEKQAAEAHALRFAAEGHLRAVLAAGWADSATGPAAVRAARAWLSVSACDHADAYQKGIEEERARWIRITGIRTAEEASNRLDKLDRLEFQLDEQAKAGALIPLPKPARVEPGQRWAAVAVVDAVQGPMGYVGFDAPQRISPPMSHSMLESDMWVYLGEAK